MESTQTRDVAVVLSGGNVNGAFSGTGFLKRLSESALWPRVGTIFATSSGGLVGTLAALDRIDDLERFLLGLQPTDVFRPRPLLSIFFRGLQEFVLPQTVARRIAPLEELAAALQASPRELAVVVTDLTGVTPENQLHRRFEIVYSSRTTSPATMAQAIFASAAIPGYVEPMMVDGVIGVDGGWLRNYPLTYAYERPEVSTIVSCVHWAWFTEGDTGGYIVGALRPALPFLSPLRAVPGFHTIVSEIEAAMRRRSRGQPVDLTDVLLRLGLIAVTRNTMLEGQMAKEKDRSVEALFSLEHEVRERVRHAGGDQSTDAAIAASFAAADFPFRHDRKLERIEARVNPPKGVNLDPGPRHTRPWKMEDKRALIAHGYAVADQMLRERGIR